MWTIPYVPADMKPCGCRSVDVQHVTESIAALVQCAFSLAVTDRLMRVAPGRQAVVDVELVLYTKAPGAIVD